LNDNGTIVVRRKSKYSVHRRKGNLRIHMFWSGRIRGKVWQIYVYDTSAEQRHEVGGSWYLNDNGNIVVRLNAVCTDVKETSGFI